MLIDPMKLLDFLRFCHTLAKELGLHKEPRSFSKLFAKYDDISKHDLYVIILIKTFIVTTTFTLVININNILIRTLIVPFN